MKFSLSSKDDGGGRPGHILGRMRTSTAALIVAFIALFWVYQTVQPEPVGSDAPTQVVPPGFVPDPNYTWVPRTNVRRPKETITTTTPTTTTTTETTTPSPTETTSPTSPTEPTPAPFAPPESVPAPTPPTTTTAGVGPGSAPTTTAPPR